ncbi:flagellar hook protein, partial [Planococcus sp. SIMBA_143]
GISLGGKVTFQTYNESGEAVDQEVEVKTDDTLNSLLKRITDEDNNVRAFYDEGTDKVIMETTRTGDYNPNGNEITFATGSFFESVLKMD